MFKTTVDKLKYSDTRIMSEYLGDLKIKEGGIYMFRPDEGATGDPHTHGSTEVLIFVQGKGEVLLSGKFYPVHAGDVIVAEATETHRTHSFVEDPLVVAWFTMEK